MTRIALEMNPEEALRLIIDASKALDAMAAVEEIVPGRLQGGLQAICLTLSVSAGILDAHLFKRQSEGEIDWIAASEMAQKGAVD